MSKKFYDAAELRENLADQIEAIVKDMFPAAKKQGNDYRIGDVDGTKGSSMAISIRPDKFGKWFDHSTNEKGDIISLQMAHTGCSYGEAITFLAERYTNMQPTESRDDFHERAPINIPKIDIESLTTPLTAEAIEYSVNVRKVSESTLKNYGVRSYGEGSVAFPSYYNGKLAKLHYSSYRAKKFGSTSDPVHTLFGKEWATPDRCKGVLTITEGQWDAMTYSELGIPAVSIPSGVSNMKWIDMDWDYLKQFHTFHISFDMDDAGREAVSQVLSRLGVNNCNVVKLPLKDASDCIQGGERDALLSAWESATPEQPSAIVSSADLMEEAWELSSMDKNAVGDPMFLNMPFRFRPHEMTLIVGYRGHGKSQFALNQVAFDIALGIPWMVGSFESQRGAILADVVRAYSGVDVFSSKEEFYSWANKVSELLFIYDSTNKPTPKELFDAFEYCHKRYGVNRFLFDNVATLKIERGDNDAQAEAADMGRVFTKSFPVHLMAVAHPRKSKDSGYEEPPHEGDIRGAAEWADYPENIIAVWRNKRKAEILSELEASGQPLHVIQSTDADTKDGQVIVRKQRFTGVDSFQDTWFYSPTKVFMPKYGIHTGFHSISNND